MSLASWVEDKHLTNDHFQSFVCWMLLFGALFAMIPPTILVVIQQGEPGCVGAGHILFTIYAHYSTYEWLRTKFTDFKDIYSEEFDDICYQLTIADSQLDLTKKPTMWVPESMLWLELAQNYTQNLVENTDDDCKNLTNVPLGIITWKKYADLLSPDNSPIEFSKIIELAQNGWNLTNPEIKNIYPLINELTFAHGHPNVTSGGILGLSVALSSLQTGIKSDLVFKFESYHCGKYSHDEEIEELEDKVVQTSPIDYTLLQTMMSRGPRYLQMAFGFESDVAKINNELREQMEFLWDDYLAFVYLDHAYGINHPICKLTGADWYSSKLDTVADAFMKFLFEDDDGRHIKDLEKYGLRPNNRSINESISIITEENGCNASTQIDTEFELPDIITTSCLRVKYQDFKKPVYLTVLLDVSSGMATEVSGSGNRWSYVAQSLPILIQNLEPDAVVDLVCFGDGVIPCSSSVEYPYGTNLTAAGASIEEFIQVSLAPKTSIDKTSLYVSLNTTFRDVTTLKENDESYHYVIMVISEDDNVNDRDTADELLQEIGLSFNPEQIHVYTICFFCTEGETTYTVLEEIALRTNGEFQSVKNELQNTITQYTYYF